MFIRSTIFVLMVAAGALGGTAEAGSVAADTSVAFVSIRSGDAHIYLRDAQGGERMLTSGKGVNTQPAWSSTGKLAFSRRVGALNKIHVVNEDGSGLRQVTDSARAAKRHRRGRPTDVPWPTTRPPQTPRKPSFESPRLKAVPR